MRRLLTTTLALAMLAGCGTTTSLPAARAAGEASALKAARAPEVLARLKPGHSLAELGLTVRRTIPALGVEAVAPAAGQSLAALRQAIDASGLAEWSDAARAIPGESLIAHPERLVNWSPANPVKEDQPSLKDLRVPEAWPLSRGAGVKIAIVDGPLSTDHLALRGQFEETWNVPAHHATLDRGSVFKFHATVTAGVIGSVRGGTLGVAPESRLLAVQVRDASGGTEDQLAEGMAWATDHGAQVMTVYPGAIAPEGGRPSSVILEAVKYALAHDVVVVTTAGNDRTTLDAAKHPIATYPGVLTVASGDAAGRRYDRTNQGPQISVAAPALDVIAPFPGPFGAVQYLKLTCTSWGAAHVAGVAALVRARHPEWRAEAVRTRLTDTAHDLGTPGVDPVFGHGLVDAAAAVQ